MGRTLAEKVWDDHVVRRAPGEPDLLYMRSDHRSRIHDYWDGADFVLEVVSPGNPEHDRKIKRDEYARAGVPEYWLVDLIERQIVVHVLRDGAYDPAGTFRSGALANSTLLEGWSVAVDAILAAGEVG